ncbi:MAG: hypothetical protein GX029_02390 [Pseudomonadaceae bacterium]|nr:hypothetical protein [Pseudomonadaceae bacterium]
MLLPSVESSNSSLLNRQKKNVASNSSPTAKPITNENQLKPADQHPKIKVIDEKTAQQQKSQESLQILDDSTFASSFTSNYPDYTLEINNKNSSFSTPTTNLKPDEVRFGRKRPPLPVSFGFGLRRLQAVAVAMRHPLLEGKQPSTAAQAILDTFDLAATNRLPYIKGSGINLAA